MVDGYFFCEGLPFFYVKSSIMHVWVHYNIKCTLWLCCVIKKRPLAMGPLCADRLRREHFFDVLAQLRGLRVEGLGRFGGDFEPGIGDAGAGVKETR